MQHLMPFNLRAVVSLVAVLAPSTTFAQTNGHWAETIPPGEQDATSEVTAMLASKLRQETLPGATMHRDAHAKHHGCVEAKFKIDESLPSDLAIGVFKPGSTYDAMIRFSNGSGKSDDDRNGDGRGFAMKIYGVEGEKALKDPEFADQQDFLMINYPAFFVRNASDYVEFTRSVTSGSPLKFFFPGLNPANWRINEMKVARAIQGQTLVNPLAGTYFSMTPYALGEHKVVKYRVSPCHSNVAEGQRADSHDYLRHNMALTLSHKSSCFEFAVQSQVDGKAQPVEDPTVIWSESVSSFRRVGVVTVASQTFDTSEKNDLCEKSSLNPWHALESHRPLGGINRVRKTVYEAIRNLRQDYNR